MSIGKEFIEKTKYKNFDKPADQELGKPQPSLEKDYGNEKIYNLTLPEKLDIPKADLRTVIEERKSLRKFDESSSLSFDELSYLLWITQGVKKTVQHKATFRTVPSAGARHAFETYLLINNVEGLYPGLYRYIALEHILISVDAPKNIAELIFQASLEQQMIKTCAVYFIWTAMVYRMNWRYNERGYRYLHLDAGHVCQNLYLGAESIGCGACGIGAYLDDEFNAALDIDGEEEFVIYAAAVGRKEK